MAGGFTTNLYDANKLLQVRRDLLADVLRPYGVPKRSPPPTPLDPASMRTQTRSGYSLPYGLPPPAVAAFTLPRGAFIPQGTKPAVVSRALAGLSLDLTRAGVPVRATGNGGLYGLGDTASGDTASGDAASKSGIDWGALFQKAIDAAKTIANDLKSLSTTGSNGAKARLGPNQGALPDSQIVAVYIIAFGHQPTGGRLADFRALTPTYNTPALLLHRMTDPASLPVDGPFGGPRVVADDPRGAMAQSFNAAIQGGGSFSAGGTSVSSSGGGGLPSGYIPPAPADSSTLLLLGAAAVGLVLLVNSRSAPTPRATVALSGVAHRRRRRRR